MADAADQGPVPFSADDFAARRVQAADAAQEAGLAGLLMTPGPDLLYLTGYAPAAITERITMLVIPIRGDSRMIVPKLERQDAENAPGVAGLQLVDWADGSDPYEATARLLTGTGRHAISDSAWAMHLLGLQGQLPQSSYVSLTASQCCVPSRTRRRSSGWLLRLPRPTGHTRGLSTSGPPVAGRRRSPLIRPVCCASSVTRRWTSPSWAPGRTEPTPP
jgi:Creatinase/Prolidase N-terminal domain